MNKAKREVINVWPVANRGVFKGFVKITFAESVAVFPMKLMEGNHGYFLGFPKVTQSDGTKRHAGRFLYQDANRMLTEDVLRSYIPGTPICREFQMLHFSEKRMLSIEHENMARYATETWNGRPRILKLHRGVTLGVLNKKTETEQLSEKWTDAINAILKEYIPIVVGYCFVNIIQD